MVPGDEIQTDANVSPESSAPETTSPETQSAATESPTPDSAVEDKNVPFHEHPRFKELIEERRQASEQAKAFQSEIAEMRKQMTDFSKPKEQPKEHPFLQELGKINPEYAKYLKDLESKASQVSEFQEWKRTQEHQTIVQQYESSFEKLCSDNKVSADLKDLYKAQLDAMAIRDPKLGLKEIPGAFKSIHDRFAKLNRTITSQYVQDKSKTAATPTTQPKGQVAGGRNEKGQFTQDREAMLSSIATSALSKSRAASGI